MLTSLIGRIVAASARHPLIVLLLAVALTAMALVYSSRHFAMTADTAELISTKHEWRQRELAYEAAFPSLQKLTVVVIDGATAGTQRECGRATGRGARQQAHTVSERAPP